MVTAVRLLLFGWNASLEEETLDAQEREEEEREREKAAARLTRSKANQIQNDGIQKERVNEDVCLRE